MRGPAPAPRLALMAITAALVLASCGGDDGEESAATAPLDLGPDPAAITPADAPLYAEVVVRPGGEQAERLRAALSKLLDHEDPGGLIVEELDELLDEDLGVTYAEAIEPWLGPRIGGFLSDLEGDLSTGEGFAADGALAVSVTDREAAIEALAKIGEEAPEGGKDPEEKRYRGVDYLLDPDGVAFGFVDDFMVFATEDGFRSAVDATRADSLADSDLYLDRLEQVDEERLLTFFVNGERAVEVLEGTRGFSRRELDAGLGVDLESVASGSVIGAGTASEETLELTTIGPPSSSAREAGGAAAELLAELPADAWLAFGFSGAREILSQALTGANAEIEAAGVPGLGRGGVGGLLERRLGLGLDLERDLLGWVGDVAFFIEGTSPLSIGAGLVIESTDPAASKRALAKLERLVSRRFGLETESAEAPEAGFSIAIPGLPFGAAAVQRGDRVVIAGGQSSPDELLDPGADEGTLGGSERWEQLSEALGEGIEPAFLLDFPLLLGLIESVPGAALDPDFESAARYLRNLDYFVVGTGSDSERSAVSIVLGLREGGEGSGAGDEAAAAIVGAR